MWGEVGKWLIVIPRVCCEWWGSYCFSSMGGGGHGLSIGGANG